MLKKALLAVAIGLVGFTAVFAQQPKDFVFIGDVKYNQIMVNASKPDFVAKFELGEKAENVGGHKQDVNRYTEGFPNAFRGGSTDSEIWILDAINGFLKLFDGNELKKSVEIKAMGNVHDFAISNDNKYIAFLNRTTGVIYITDMSGRELAKATGYEYANSVEFTSDNHILVVHPMGQGIAKLDIAGELKDTYIADETLTNISNESGLWGFEGMFTTNAKLVVRTSTDPDAVKVVAEFPFNEYKSKEVLYKGADIYGFDVEGNIYFGLTACDPLGVIYRDRLYKCSTDGKILKELDILDHSVVSPNLPRHKTVNKFGRVYSVDADYKNYYLQSWEMGK